MLRYIIVVCVFILFSQGSLNAQEKNYWYHYLIHGKKIGYIHERVLGPDSYSGRWLFEYTYVLKIKNQIRKLHLRIITKNDKYFSPLYIKRSGNIDGKVTFHGIRKGNWMTVVLNNKRIIKKEITSDTVAFPVTFEIVRRLSGKQKHTVFKFSSLEATEMNLKKDHKILFDSITYLKINGVLSVCKTYVQKGIGISPAIYWVDSIGRMVRMQMDQYKEIILTTQQKAQNFKETAVISRLYKKDINEKWYTMYIGKNNLGYYCVKESKLVGDESYKLFHIYYQTIAPFSRRIMASMKVITRNDKFLTTVYAKYKTSFMKGEKIFKFHKNSMIIIGKNCIYSSHIKKPLTSSALITVIGDSYKDENKSKIIYYIWEPSGKIIVPSALIKRGNSKIYYNSKMISVVVYSFKAHGGDRLYVSKNLGVIRYETNKSMNLRLSTKAESLLLFKEISKEYRK